MDVTPWGGFQRVGTLWLPRATTPAPMPVPWPDFPPPPLHPAPAKPEPPTIRMVGDRRMQCKDIPDDAFLDAVRRTPGVRGDMAPEAWRMRWEVQAELEKGLGPIPEKLFLAKARRLGRRGLLGGCTDCSCRGDYHIAAECPWDSCCPKRK